MRGQLGEELKGADEVELMRTSPSCQATVVRHTDSSNRRSGLRPLAEAEPSQTGWPKTHPAPSQ